MRRIFLLAFALFYLTACFEVKEEITIREDMSGTQRLTLKMQTGELKKLGVYDLYLAQLKNEMMKDASAVRNLDGIIRFDNWIDENPESLVCVEEYTFNDYERAMLAKENFLAQKQTSVTEHHIVTNRYDGNIGLFRNLFFHGEQLEQLRKMPNMGKILNTATYELTLNAPGIVSADGAVAPNRKTATWKFKMSDVLDADGIQVSAVLDGRNPMAEYFFYGMAGTGSAFALLSILLATSWLTRR